MKAMKCKVIFDKGNGDWMRPVVCKSIMEALRLARMNQLAFRIYDMEDKLIKTGWFNDRGCYGND